MGRSEVRSEVGWAEFGDPGRPRGVNNLGWGDATPRRVICFPLSRGGTQPIFTSAPVSPTAALEPPTQRELHRARSTLHDTPTISTLTTCPIMTVVESVKSAIGLGDGARKSPIDTTLMSPSSLWIIGPDRHLQLRREKQCPRRACP